MDAFATLKLQAREKRDKAIAAAQSEYVGTLCEISRLSRRLHRGRSRPRNYGVRDGQSYDTMTVIRAAELVLLEGTPLTIAELTVEIQARGCRTQDNPRTVARAIRSSLAYHRGRFVKDKAGRWTLNQP